jgi:hypothetical protein
MEKLGMTSRYVREDEKPFVEITEDEFYETYRPRARAAPNTHMFETYGRDMKFVLKQDPRTIWTLMQYDGPEFIWSGLHFGNRIGHFISKVPVPEEMEFQVNFDGDEDPEDELEENDDE